MSRYSPTPSLQLTPAAMPKTTINAEALDKLKELSEWAYEAKNFVEEERQLFRCADNERHAKIRPLLRKLGFENTKGHGYKIWRICGQVPIKKAPEYQTLFFPLSIGSGPESIASGEVQINGETLTPGDYIPILDEIKFDIKLDCLIVLLPAVTAEQ